MPVSDQEFEALKRRVARLEILVRQLQGTAAVALSAPSQPPTPGPTA